MSRIGRAPERKVHGLAIQAGIRLATIGDTSVTEATRPTATWGTDNPPTHSEVNGSIYLCVDPAVASEDVQWRRVGGAWVRMSVLSDLQLAATSDVTITAGGEAVLTAAVHTIRGAGGLADNLDTISGMTATEIAFLLTGAEAITYRDASTGAGNIAIQRDASITTAPGDLVMAVLSGTVVRVVPLMIQAGVPTSSAGTGATGTPSAAVAVGDGTHTHAGGAVTGSTDTEGTGATSGDVTRDQIYLGALAADGVNYIGAYAGGAGAIDDAVGPWAAFLPTRTVQILGNAALVASTWTIDMVDHAGTAIQDVITHPGGAVIAPGVLAGRITRVRSNVDPGAGATATVETGPGFGVGVRFAAVEVGVDGVVEAPISSNGATGTVVPTSAPNGVRVYAVRTDRTHTHTGPAHTHAAGTLTSPTSGTPSATVSVGDGTHTHTGPAHTHQS